VEAEVAAEEAVKEAEKEAAEKAVEKMIIRLEAETGNTTIIKRKNEDYHLQLSNLLHRQLSI
jgi:hypothetical protein